jgi:tetratricopeptide (TPR) repeat protein
LMTRAYYHLADFNNDDYFTQIYTERANSYVDSVLHISAPDTFTFLYFKGLRSARMSNIEEGLTDLEKLYRMGGMSYHQLAVLTSTLSDFYLRLGNTEKAIQLLAKAAIYDIKSCTKETAAILILANIVHQQGDLKSAYRYTKKALDDANFYGARHRKIEVGNILPIIEEEKLSTAENQKQILIFFLAITIVLALIVIAFVVVVMKQLKRLRFAKMEIDKAHTVLQEINYKLQETNNKLSEANRIKEEYIGYYFNINSDYIDKIEKFKRSIDQNLMANKFDNIRYVVNNINLKKEREELNKSFDKVFLKLFPGFVAEFNSFFKEEDQIKLTDNELLNTDLRIFALIRMGIHDNDKIAKILNYSVNTIYAYKTRIKNKSLIPNEEFEKRMMEIKHV